VTALAETAVVVGAGIAGLTAARALSPHCDRVIVVERDPLGDGSGPRSGVPQGRHLHALLPGGLMALEFLFPGIERDLEREGAVPLIGGFDVQVERPGRSPDPRRDLGLPSRSLSRPLLEGCIRRRVVATPNVELEPGVRALRLELGSSGQISGVELSGGRHQPAELVVDASGRGDLTLELLRKAGLPEPRTTSIGVDVHYATAVFEIPDPNPVDWKGCLILPRVPRSSRGVLIVQMEGGRWMCGLAGRGDEAPPGDLEGFLAFTQELHSRSVYDAISLAKPIGEISRYRFPASYLRHFEELAEFPAGLLPVGDALCRFNPIYGQGMSVAAVQLERLARRLEDDPGSLDTLAPRFFEIAAEPRTTAWAMSALPDLIFPTTVGERPADLFDQLKYHGALTELGHRDPEVHRLLTSVAGLVTPWSALFEPSLAERVRALQAEWSSV